jgi:hypothetical protein
MPRQQKLYEWVQQGYILNFISSANLHGLISDGFENFKQFAQWQLYIFKEHTSYPNSDGQRLSWCISVSIRQAF